METRTIARVLFDEAHSEAWTLDPARAAAMQPSHPADASYAQAAALLAEREFSVGGHRAGPLDAAALAGADVLVIAHPSDPAFERTTGIGEPRFTAAELDAIEAWVAAGGGLVLLGEEEQAKYGTNLAELAARFGIKLRSELVQDYDRCRTAPSWILPELADAGRGAGGDLLARVREICLYRATSLAAPGEAQVIARAGTGASSPGAPLIAAAQHGAGRVVVLGDSDLFGDDCLGELDHRALWLNLVAWVARHAFAHEDPAPPSPAAADSAWAALRAEVEALRAVQAPDGTVDLTDHPRAGLDARVERIDAALGALAPRFPHQAEHLVATRADLARWREGGYGAPDFTRSLAAFRPEQHREDGIEHLVLFPMYKQNGPREKVFEALIVRVPWPGWLAELERTRYGNPKFVPVTFVDHTSGYASESAVLFPETVTARETVNNFGAIFCDREAARLARTMAAAAEILRLNLPPDAAALLASPSLLRDAYVLWDLVHDRTHARGDLPFDPFMIRQRAPYWMYGLEELRCDLTAFREATILEAEGFPFARHVQYAILFDRLFRFPITGERRRNYDGLGGQLLFAFLHQEGHLAWTDNELTIDWETVTAGVGALRARVEELYRRGIDSSKLGYWAAAHDLVAEYVSPAAGSRWARGVRDFDDVEDPRPYIDEVREDEFPLSIFYATLRRKLAPPLPPSVPAPPAPVAA